MSIATISQPRRTRAARRPATLTLTVQGVPFDVRPYDYEGDGQSTTGIEHTLRGPEGPRFAVYGVEGGFHCDRCERDGCVHIYALGDVGLI